MIAPLRLRRLLACCVLVALAVVSAPAASQQPSSAQYKVLTQRNVMVPMADGTRLAIDIYRPDAPGKFPALIERTPYDKTKSSEIQVGAHTYFAERGYVFMVQDTRGRFASEGTFYPFLDDGWLRNRDGYDTVQWIAQQAWSDGKVGALGGSYTGQTAYMIAPTQPAALRAMFVRESASDLFDHWSSGGAFELGFIATWSTHLRPDIVARAFRGEAAERQRAPRAIAEQTRTSGVYRCHLPAALGARLAVFLRLGRPQPGRALLVAAERRHAASPLPGTGVSPGRLVRHLPEGDDRELSRPARARRHCPGARQPEARDRPLDPRPD
jgi:hypothetical protein